MKIGLIAMSGVRACDPELLELGLTLPGFVERSKTIASLPSLGLLTLAGLTPSEHEVQYIEIDDIGEHPKPLDFDVVAISSFSAQIKEGYKIADRYREAGIPVVMGGLHVSKCPDEALLHADAVVIGEGELSWLKVLEDVQKNQLKQYYYPLNQEFDLADAPMPRYDLLDINKYNRITVQTSRGCPFQCSFCASSILLTSKYKQKPIKKVLAEIDAIRELWPRPFIEFADDNSFVNRRYWRELLPELAKRKLKWFTETDVAVGEDIELLKLMKQAGCVEVLIGLESPIATGLDNLELKNNWKAKKLKQYEQSIYNIQSHGIRVNGCFILGLEGHTPAIFEDVYQYANRLQLFDVQITMLTPFPGTPLYEQLKREDRLIEPEAWEKCTLFDVNFIPSDMTPEQLRLGFHELTRKLYNEEATIARRKSFKDQYREGNKKAKCA